MRDVARSFRYCLSMCDNVDQLFGNVPPLSQNIFPSREPASALSDSETMSIDLEDVWVDVVVSTVEHPSH